MDLIHKIMKGLRPEDRGKYPPENRRKNPRVSLDLPFEYWTQDYSHSLRGGIVIDASEVGFLIYSVEDMPIGRLLNIVVLYISGYGLTNLEVWGEIVWKNYKKEGRYLYGLKFIKVFSEDHDKLKGLLRHNSIETTISQADRAKMRERINWA